MTKNFKTERVKSPSYFDKRSFRTVEVDDHRVTVGCKKGFWDDDEKTCTIGTEAQRIMHPRSEPNPCDRKGQVIETACGDQE